MSESSRGGGKALILVLLLVCALYALFPVSNGNFFWHIRNGQDILSGAGLRTADPFTHTRSGCEWLQAEWLAEVLLYLPWSIAGGAAVVLFKCVVVCATVLLVVITARRSGGSTTAAVAVAVLCLSLVHPRWIARPHIFTDLLFAAYLLLLVRPGRSLRSDLAIFLPLQIVWVNTHAGFTMGLFLLGLEVLDPLFGRNWTELRDRLILLAGALAVCGVHPNGFGSIRYTTAFLEQPLFRETIREWWSPFDPRFQPEHAISRSALLLILLTAALLLVVIVSGRKGRKLKVSRYVGLGVLTIAGAFAARNLELLALAAIAWVPPLLPRIRPVIPAALLGGAVALVPLIGIPREFGPSREPGLGVEWEIYPVGLADFLERSGIAGSGATVFNTNEISSYLEYRFGERLPLFMDGRCLLYPEELYAEYLVMARAPDSTTALVQMSLLQRYDIDLVLMEWPDGSGSVLHLVSILPHWRPVHLDPLTVAYARTDLIEELGLHGYSYDVFDPLEAGLLLEKPIYRLPATALPDLERASEALPDYDLPRMLLVPLYLRIGEVEAAREIAEEVGSDTLRYQLLTALDGGPETFDSPFISSLMAQVLARGGRADWLEHNLSLMNDPQFESALSCWADHVLHPSSSALPVVAPPWVPPWVTARPDSLISRPETLMILASCAWTSGDAPAADSLATLALELDADSGSAWLWSCGATISLLHGETEEALRRSETALSIGATPFSAATSARVLLALGRAEEAVEKFALALDLSPISGEASVGLFEALWEAGRLDDVELLMRGVPREELGFPPSLLRRLDWLSTMADRP